MATLFHISDLHFGAEDRSALDWLEAQVRHEKPDAIICTGDLTMRGTKREFDAAADYLAALPVPVSIEPGNHDMPYYHEMLTRLRHPFRRFEAMHSRAHRPVPLPDVSVVSMPTVTPAQWRLNWSKGCVKPRVLAAALQQLSGAGPEVLKLVACHHPLVDADTEGSGSTRGGTQALAALAAAGVDAVLSGHVHDPFDLMVETANGPIRIIGAGTLSERTRATEPSYNRLEWTQQAGLSVTVQVAG
ncbi:metallophosphoesterase [Novosphingobium umbonatum]|uniref:Metallophosphoesterase n=1 Tax=Novosphingobium umbonatum TaxID=1908524 RepID=A0A3S2UU50_9SPHN|nr:metallophosphoesterase [Novosphingobium umbonatum]RVU05048.1 metallophosphoesterase [Novosphingobium umbonatum]